MANLNFNGIIRGGVIRSMQILGYGANPNPNPPGPTPLQVSSSVRFNSSDSAYISYTPTLQGSRTTWTWSAWIKRSGLSTIQNLFAARSGSESTFWRFESSNVLVFYTQNSAGTGIASYSTVAVLRDVSAWYHVLLAIDTTQSTAANRVIMYINGVQQTLTTGTTVSQYTQLFVNGYGYPHAIGLQPSIGEYFNGYMADINFVDGQALTPSAFTETDTATGQLIPLTYAGSYGVNGFYLPFGNGATVAELGFNPKTTAQDYPYWPYNTLLINSSSTNGAQNNTFLDSSTNNFTVTRNGNTTQGNFTPFTFGGGTTQADGYYSGYFDGTGDYITTPSNAAFNLGTGDFTIETWIYLTKAINNSTLTTIFGYGTTLESNGYIIDSGSATTGGFRLVNLTNPYPQVDTLPIQLNTWTHIAFCRSGATLRSFVNGVQNGSISVSANYSPTNSPPLTIAQHSQIIAGREFSGYISNLRLVKGTAVYTANFTVPTTPLTNITNTSLLTCQSSQFIDNSTNAFAITANGNSQPLPTNPFGMTAWSGYFDGTGDYLTTPSNAAFYLATDDFTVEAFVYRTTSGREIIVSQSQNSGAPYHGWLFYVDASDLLTWEGTNGSRIQDTTALTLNTWFHVAAVRSSGTTRLYKNGVQVASGTPSITNFAGNLTIGQYTTPISGSEWLGNISNLRIVKGTAVYTSAFTPPTAPLTAISGTSLLTCQSSTFIDNSTNAFPITVNGNAYMGTLNNPFNNPINYTTPPVQAWSNYYDGGANSLTVAANTALDLTGNFTIEFWAWAIDTSTNYMCNGTQSGSGCWRLQMVPSTGQVLWSLAINSWAGVNISSPTGVFSPKQWVHFAVTRSGNDHKVFVNGIVVASTTVAGSLVNTGRITQIGYYTESGGTFYSKCYFSNLRIIKGTALYTANFAPPTAPLTAVQNTTLLTCQSSTFVDNSIINSTITRSGSPSISTLSPFIPTQAWSAASYGGSMYFDGSDYLTAPHDASLSPTGNFTIEFWVYNTGSTAVQEWVTKGYGIQIYSYNSLWYAAFSANNTTTYFVNASFGTALFNTWQHIAVTRSGNTYTGFVNGVATSLGTSASAPGTGTNLFAAGASTVGTAYFVTGYMSGLRVINGTALYTTPFVPPVLPPTAVTNTSLLLNATNSGIYDATGENVIETVGNAQVSTAVKKWGESSVYFDGTGDYLIIPPNIQNYFSGAQTTGSNKDFTIEFWFYSVNTSISATLLLRRASAGPLGIAISQLANAQLFFGFGDTDQGSWNVTYTSSSNVFTVNTWNHIAATRLGTTYRFFLNGVQIYTAAPSAFVIAGDTLPMYIATNGTEASQFPFNGYIQDFRLTIGAARYQGAFTPPTAAFAYNQYDICNQQLLPANISVTAGTGQDNLADSPSDYGTDTGAGGEVRGNYATMSPIDTVGGTFANANLDVGVTSAAGRYIRATIAPTSGKWYWEATVLSTTGIPSVGVAATTAVPSGGLPVIGVTYSSNAVVLKDSTNLGTQTAWSVNNVVGIAYDADNLTIALYLNNALQTTVNLTTGYTYAPLFMSYSNATATSAVAFNFGQRAFAYAAPTGFKCLVSTNLPMPTIGATSTTRADDYVDLELWTGTGANRSITGFGFAPDFVWIKGRSQVTNSFLFDILRGATNRLCSSLTVAQASEPNTLTAFNSDGFSLGTDAGVGACNLSGQTYVGWCWKANGAGSTNTAGSITSTVSANTTSGCSVVTWTGNGTNGATIGHGLGVAPVFTIIKSISGINSWYNWHQNLSGNNYGLSLNTTDAQTIFSFGNLGTKTSTTLQLVTGPSGADNVNLNGRTYVAYCFAAVAGYSAFGSYTGNGSADGPFVYLGFRPTIVLYKRTDSTSDWWIMDRERTAPYNVVNGFLYPNSSAAEGAADGLDFLSNGFKIRRAGTTDTNASGGTYIYAAFAEFPFKYARAR